MIGRGHEVALLANPGASIVEAAHRMSIPTYEADVSRKGLRSLLSVRRWLMRHAGRFDIINTHGSTDSWLTAVASMSCPGRQPTIIRTRHVSTPINNNPATRWLYTKATAHIVTTGEAIRQQLERNNGYPLENMTSVRTGIDLNYFRPRNQRHVRLELGLADVPTIGVVATLRSWKGHEDLLLSFSCLRRRFPTWRLIIIGDGPQRVRLGKRVEELALCEAVRFVGNVENVAEWLAALDLFALPSYGDEGVPQSIMQAMACGLAVVSTPIGAIAEAIQDGRTGLLVPPRNSTALTAALSQLMDDPLLRARMGQAGAALAKAEFGIETMLSKMEEVFYRHSRICS